MGCEEDMMKIDFAGKYKLWVLISAVFILAGLVLIPIRGLNLGVDFAGGSFMYVNIGQPYDVEELRDLVADKGIVATVAYAGVNNEDAVLRIRHTEGLDEKVDELIAAMQEKYGLEPGQFSVDTVGPVIGRELTMNAIWALVIASGLILVYIWFRFEFRSAVVAILALVHDVLVMVATVSLLNIQINSPFVAVMLTIVGYSINDTIVVFDRIRENNKRFGKKISKPEIVNKSTAETITRSINTALTTLLVVLALYVFGVEAVREFAMPLIVGIIGGAYSSIFIAAPLWAAWDERTKKPRAETAA
jgi:preprotein translocase subunit SecF